VIAAAERERLDPHVLTGLPLRRLVTDSRQVQPGDTFLAYPGEAQDGRRYIADALAAGAGCVLWEARGFRWPEAWKAPNRGIRNLRRHAGQIAAAVYGRPTAALWVVGVTGTNGKTSCSQWIAQALTRTGRKCGVIGTLGSGSPGRLEPLLNTTPDGVWLQARMARFLRHNAEAVAMEVSSIGLDQDRVSGIEFDVALLTNLTRDHLDYHRTMARYRRAKAQLFRWPGLKHAVLNLEDDFGVALLREMERSPRVAGYGFELPRGLPRRSRLTRIIGSNLRLGSNGVSFDVKTPWGEAAVASRMIGRFNALNLLGVLSVLLASGVPLERAARAVERVRPVPGRLERHGGGRRPLAVIDYAHTPDALEKVLETLREAMSDPAHAARRPRRGRTPRLICVFGCGGDRDAGKRPLMGSVATRLADRVVLTSDNPRNEDADRIIADILKGASEPCDIEPDRKRAIRRALGEARPGDVVLIAGKGHEQYQTVRGVNYRYSDAEVVKSALRELWS
jgi:UDP-N-acetylmuramoyl-L-alanyl-D-glutamate--2,6-diaminopimelate ligase